jgi:myosin-crossreactive antigen
MQEFSGNEAGTGGLVTFKDSNWLMSIILAHQPHFIDRPADVQVFWGYALFPDRVGNVVFTVEYSIRAAQMAVYEFLSIDRKISPVTPHDKSLRVEFEALVKAFK